MSAPKPDRNARSFENSHDRQDTGPFPTSDAAFGDAVDVLGGEAICRSCRHWDTEPHTESLNVRKCKRIPQWWDATTWDDDGERVLTPAAADVLAFANDGSSWAASLLTRAEFGCVMHEPWPSGTALTPTPEEPADAS